MQTVRGGLRKELNAKVQTEIRIMGTFYFIIVFIAVLAFYAYANMKLKRDYVICVEAGDSEEANPQELRNASHYTPHRIIRDKNGRIVNTSKMLRIKVSGNCMKPYGIESGDELLVKKISKDKVLDDYIQQNDILLIYLSDKRMYKIRAFDRFENGSLKTYRFLDNGERKDSRKLHSRESVVGVVEYKI